MGALVARRLIASLGLLIAVTIVAYVFLYFSSDTAARSILGDSASQEQVAAKEIELGLDQPLPIRYAQWLGGALRGDLGQSWMTPETVTAGIVSRLPVTVSVCLLVLGISSVLAVLLGTAAALRGGFLDRLLQMGTLLGFAVPPFLIAIAVVNFLAIQNRWFPATGYTPFGANPLGWATTLALPALSLLVGTVASGAQQIRGAVIDISRRDFVRTLRSRGLPEHVVIFKHVLRNAGPAALTVVSLQFVYLLGGSFVIETVFALPGIGQLAVQATASGNLPMIMGIVTYSGLMVIVVNMATDIAAAWLNPKGNLELDRS